MLARFDLCGSEALLPKPVAPIVADGTRYSTEGDGKDSYVVATASPVTLIKQCLNIDAVCTVGKTGQFDVIADGEKIAERGGNWLTRSFGAGYPGLDSVIELLGEKYRAS